MKPELHTRTGKWKIINRIELARGFLYMIATMAAIIK